MGIQLIVQPLVDFSESRTEPFVNTLAALGEKAIHFVAHRLDVGLIALNSWAY